ncbi:MAG: A/G-specific adenine glycosylase [Sedimentisphaerales bacterium]|nr:A/G-specific adenine glycosylase [Sedimentisphaerales bacterium]
MTEASSRQSSKPVKRAVIRPLLRWFDRAARDLPWRRTKDPYAIWVSEVMLQQTQVETVRPYYERFLRRFPTVQHLARARLDTVLKLWEGLGYYSRARNLHRAAGQIVARYDGHLPPTGEELVTLPGIGAYTAGAIASIAFGRREPVVDGNVTRLLCRVFRIRTDPKDSATQKEIWRLAQELLPTRRAGDFNQALMELGSEICLPRRPLCAECPLCRVCQARQHDEETVLPLRRARKAIPSYTIAIGVIYNRQGRILIDKRKPEGLLGGLWEFPGGKKEPSESLQKALRREVREELGIQIRVGRLLAVVDHAYSHFRVRLHAFICEHLSGTPRCITCSDVRWVSPASLRRYAFPAANTKIIQALREKDRRRH